jgi:DNA adenine methylase
MQYLGGKQRVASKLAEFMQPFIKDSYVEPFVGGGSMMAAMSAPIRIGSDINVALINMWRALADGWEPPKSLSESEYAEIRAANNYDDPLTAFAAIGCLFSGKWWGGYARNAIGHNYAQSAVNSLHKKMVTLGGVDWRSCDYRELEYPCESVIYCDPPYKGTVGYAGAPGKFNHDIFWQFYRDKASEGHTVFISEYNAPHDFTCCLEVRTKTSLRTADGNVSPRIERLFTFKSQMNTMPSPAISA